MSCGRHQCLWLFRIRGLRVTVFAVLALVAPLVSTAKAQIVTVTTTGHFTSLGFQGFPSVPGISIGTPFTFSVIYPPRRRFPLGGPEIISRLGIANRNSALDHTQDRAVSVKPPPG